VVASAAMAMRDAFMIVRLEALAADGG